MEKCIFYWKRNRMEEKEKMSKPKILNLIFVLMKPKFQINYKNEKGDKENYQSSLEWILF